MTIRLSVQGVGRRIGQRDLNIGRLLNAFVRYDCRNIFPAHGKIRRYGKRTNRGGGLDGNLRPGVSGLI